MTLAFGAQVAPLLLERLGVPRPWLSPALTVAQSREILSLGLLPVLLGRLGLRGTLLLGLAAPATCLCLLTLGRPTWLTVAALGFNGLGISCFVVAGQVYANRQAGRSIRASAQGLVTFLNGLGLLAGNLLAGWVRQRADGDLRLTLATGTMLAAPLVVLFLVGFTQAAPTAPAEAVVPEAA
jgi:MFS family permease